MPSQRKPIEVVSKYNYSCVHKGQVESIVGIKQAGWPLTQRMQTILDLMLAGF